MKSAVSYGDSDDAHGDGDDRVLSLFVEVR